MNKKHWLINLSFLTCLAANSICLTGCGASSKQLPVYPAEGKVTLDGTPLEGAHLFFVPDYPFPVDGKQTVPIPSAMTDEEGNFFVSTYRPRDGLPEGAYRVKISCEDRNKPQLDAKGRPVRGEYAELLPERYQSELKSGISVTIEAGKNELEEFVLSK